MHILFLLDYYTPHLGGIETVFSHIIQELNAKKIFVTVISSCYDQSLPAYEYDEKNPYLTIIRVWSWRIGYNLKAWRTAVRYAKVCRQWGNNFPPISHIHCSTYGSALLGWFVHRWTKLPVILTVHEIYDKLRYSYFSRPKAVLHHLYEKLIFAISYTAYISVSLYTYNSIRLVYGIPDQKHHMIANTVDESWTMSKSEKAKKKKSENDTLVTFLYYGHCGVSKGIDMIITILPKIIRHPQMRLVLNLTPSKRTDMIVSQIYTLCDTREWSIGRHELLCHKHASLPSSVDDSQAKITLITWGLSEDDLHTLIEESDVVLSPSLSEWYGLAQAQAHAMGKHIIAYPVGALLEILQDNVTWCDEISSEALRSAMEDYVLPWLRQSSDKVAVLFPTWEEQVKKIVGIYKIVDIL